MRLVVGKKTDLGPVGENLMRTVRLFREERRLGYAELSRKLAELGREIPPLGLRRIETGERKVDVDDLVALAFALEVSPLRLLLPTQASRITPQGDEYGADFIWGWAEGGGPLPPDPEGMGLRYLRFRRDSNPLVDWNEVMGDVAKAIADLGND